MLLLKDFFMQDAMSLAPQLLGKIIMVNHGNEMIISGQITETEAYCGLEDLGNHAKDGRRTPKNESMYLEGGHAYVYKCYGVHDMFNIVSGPAEVGEAVLIRAIAPIKNIEQMQLNRNCIYNDYRLTGGPGKVCEALGITKNHDKMPLYADQSSIQIYDTGTIIENFVSGPRVGMSRHVGDCSNWPRRFYIAKNKYVSKPLNVWYDWEGK